MSNIKQINPAVSRNHLTGSGTYNVRATEAAREKKQPSVNISVVLLDHTEVVFKVNKRDRGQVLLDLIFQHLRVAEVKFFGLQFPNDVPDTMRWLDPTKSIRKQFKRGYPYILFFRVKFYATDISTIKDEFTRYQLFLQIKLDMLEKRLPCHISTAAMIASLAIQSELGDYNYEEHQNNYVSEFKFIPNQTKEFETEIQRLHKLHRGLSPAQAEYHFIKKAQKLDMYGIEIHHAKDNDDEALDVGVALSGVFLYKNDCRINEFKWSSIVKISFKRKQFFIQLRSEQHIEVYPNEVIYSFHMDNYRACKRLWKSCVDFHSFYRLDRCMNSSCDHQHVTSDGIQTNSNDGKSDKNLFGFLTLGGRGKHKENTDDSLVTQRETSQHQQYLRTRSGSTKSKENFISSNTRDGVITDEKAPRRLSAPPSISYGIGDSVFSDNEMRAMVQQYSKEPQVEEHNFPSVDANKNFEVVPSPVQVSFELHSPDPALTASFREIHVRPEAVADLDEPAASEISVVTAAESECSSVMTSLTDKSFVFPGTVSLPFPHQSSGQFRNGIPDDLIIIRIKPDADGRYGFNVKGGFDQNMPITISKVATDSPAAMCSPSLHEGDHVLQINGRDISTHTHEQVVRFIRSTREHHTGHLVLLIRPNQYKAINNEAETILQPQDANLLKHETIKDDGAMLHKSMQWLEDMLDSGEILAMFDTLYRKKPGTSMSDARLPANIPKNRYRDISPYDCTRIHLKNGSSDYINASYVNMFIPGTNWTNKYAASQGPLPNTTVDFWSMVWELDATFIVMLTTVIERGRPKCCQYWPDVGTSIQFGSWIIQSVSEEITPSFAYRDFKLFQYDNDGITETESTTSRLVRQMQYIAWPDHGVPDDSSDFLDFVLQVRQNRVGMRHPCIVHCSAGIGRTGVLITMETAMCLIEAGQPVYPIEIARTMRDQRAMMIQTPSQFRFVCEAILRVYKEGLAKPISDDDFEDQNSSDDDNLITENGVPNGLI